MPVVIWRKSSTTALPIIPWLPQMVAMTFSTLPRTRVISQGLALARDLALRHFPEVRVPPSQQSPTYLLFYRELSQKVEMLQILHGARNLPLLFE